MTTDENTKNDSMDSTPLFSNQQALEQVLFAVTQPNNSNLKRATLILQDFLQKPKSLMPLLNALEKSQKAEVRQVAAIYVREQIEVHWKKVPNEIKDKLKNFLLSKLFDQKCSKGETLAIAAALTSTAKFTLVKESWPQLCQSIGKGALNNETTQTIQEACYTIWRNILQYCGGSLKSNFGKILEILKRGLKSQSVKIQLESTKGIGAMVEFLENQKEIEIIQDLIPDLVSVVEGRLKAGDEDNVIGGMEVLLDLVESQVPILSKHGVKLTKFMLKIASAKDKLPLTVRKQGVNFLTLLCKSKPKIVTKNDFVHPFLFLCISLVIESEELEKSFKEKEKNNNNNDNNNNNNNNNNNDNNNNGNDKNEDTKEEEAKNFVSPLGIACDLLDEIFLNIPSDKCFPLAIKAIQQLLQDKESKKRKGAFVTMTMMAEGCSEVITKGDNLNIMLKATVGGLSDPDPTIRKCSLEAIAQYATYISEDLIKYHKQILPNIFKLFQNQNEEIRVKERALNAIEMFIDCSEDDDPDTPSFKITDYLEQLMNVVGNCLKSKTKVLQTQAIATLSSVAAASNEHFVKFLPQVMNLLEQLLQIKDTNQLELRCEAVACVGAVAKAVGKKNYGPYLIKYHKFIMEGIQKYDSTSIRECTFMYITDLADLMGQEIMKMESFDDMLYLILMTMADDDGLMVQLPDDGFGSSLPQGYQKTLEDEENNNNNDNEEEEDSLKEIPDEELQKMIEEAIKNSEEEQLEEEELLQQAVGQMKNVKLQVTTGFMEEKAAAIHCLTRLIRVCKSSFLKHIDDCWEQIVYLWEYPHQLVKMALVSCVHELLNLIVTIGMSKRQDKSCIYVDKDGFNRYNWKQGDDSFKFSQPVQKWIDKIFPMYIQSIIDEEDKDTLMMILDNLNEELRTLGPSSIKKHMESLCSAISQFLKEKTPCHVQADLENEDTAKVATKHKFVSDCVAELIALLAELWGQKFVPIFDKFYPNIIRWSATHRHPNDQAMAIGCIADVATRFAKIKRGIMDKYGESAFKIALRVAQSQDNNTRQNALYAIGSLFLACNKNVISDFSQTCLRCVNTYMKFPNNKSRGEQLTRDNAVSALGKIIMSHPSEFNNTEELLSSFLNSLPLTADKSEWFWCIKTILYFIKNNDMKKYISNNIEKTLNILANCLPDKRIDNKSKEEIVECLKNICKNENIRKLIDTKLNSTQQQIIKRAITGNNSN